MTYTPVVDATVRQGIAKFFIQLLVANKPTGWSVTAQFTPTKKDLPQIVVNPAKLKTEHHSFDRTRYHEHFEIVVDFYALVDDRKGKIDEGKDYVKKQIIDNITTLRQNNLVWDNLIDGDSGSEDIDAQTQLNTGSLTIEGKKIYGQ